MSISYLACVTGFVVCFIFPAIVSHMFIFPLRAEFPKILHALPHQSDVYPASMFKGSVNRVCERRKRGPGLVSRSLLSPAKPCLFLDLPHNNTQLSPTHTLSHTHCAQSSLRKQATAITRSQTGAAFCRKTCSHVPGSWLTHHCPIIHYST